MSFTSKLTRPYYLETSAGKRWMSCLRTAAFVSLFLLIFQPFGLNNLKEGIATVSLGYGLTTFLVMAFLNSVFLPAFPRYFSEEKWNVLRELYWNMVNVLLIGLANALYSAFIGMAALSVYGILIFELYTVTIAVFPIAMAVFLKEKILKEQYEKQSEAINSVIHEQRPQQKEIGQEAEVRVVSENQKDVLCIPAGALIFIQSADNYIEVHYEDGGKPVKKLIRNSLKVAAQDLAAHTDLFRCHKSYLVNMKRIRHVSGNAQGYKLHLSGADRLIPVSRQHNEAVKDRFHS